MPEICFILSFTFFNSKLHISPHRRPISHIRRLHVGVHLTSWQTKSGLSPTQWRLSGLRCDDATSRERAEKKIDASSQAAPECYSCQWHPQSREAVRGKDIEMMNENVSGLWHFSTGRRRCEQEPVYRLTHDVRISGFFSCPVAGGQD
jgi:hypothetical protein